MLALSWFRSDRQPVDIDKPTVQSGAAKPSTSAAEVP